MVARTIKKTDIPKKKQSSKPKSPWRVRVETDLMEFAESEDEALEFIDSVAPDTITRRSAVLRSAVRDLGIEGVKVVKRGNRLFVVKEDEAYE